MQGSSSYLYREDMKGHSLSVRRRYALCMATTHLHPKRISKVATYLYREDKQNSSYLYPEDMQGRRFCTVRICKVAALCTVRISKVATCQ
jgi:hypothetical protein